jgi:hypothetical protein
MHRFALVGVLAVAACGGDDSPEEKCETLINIVCDRAVECIGGATEAQCRAEVGAAIPCGSATSVGATYDSCTDMLRANSCAVLFPIDPNTMSPTLVLPNDCVGVIVVGGE